MALAQAQIFPEKKLAVSEGAKELQSAKDGLTLLKRQLNDLMGREIDEELIITPPELTTHHRNRSCL